MLIRGHLWTSIDPAAVLLCGIHCSMLRPAVNRQPGFRRGLVEQSNAGKNHLIGWLAGWLDRWLAGCLAGCLSGCLPAWLTG